MFEIYSVNASVTVCVTIKQQNRCCICLHVCFLSSPFITPLISLLQVLFSSAFCYLYYLWTSFQEPVSLHFNSSDFLLQHFHSARCPPCYYFISLSWHSGNNRLTNLLISFSPFSLFFVLPFYHCSASRNRQSSSSPVQNKQNQSHIPQAQFAVTSQLCALGVFELKVLRSSWVASGC